MELVWKQRCKSLLSIGGIICNFTPILLYFQHWGFEPRPILFSGKQIKRRPKEKKVFTRNGTLFFPQFKYRPALRCTPESNHWGGYIPHPSRVSAPLYKRLSSNPFLKSSIPFLKSSIPFLKSSMRFHFGIFHILC